MKKNSSIFKLEQLEPRLLFSADTLLAPVSSVDFAIESSSVLQIDAFSARETSDQVNLQSNSIREIVIIDGAVENSLQLIEELQFTDGADQLISFHILDSQQEGIQQISELLAQYQDLDSVHVISHGADGVLQLGRTTLTTDNLDQYQDQIQEWQFSLSEQADVLFYSCNLTEGDAGKALLGEISRLTQADIAASDDLTGHVLLGGDWDLETKTGEIESTELLVSSNWRGVLDATNPLWVSTDGDVDTGGQTGMDTWLKGDAVELTNPVLPFTTAADGTFSVAFSLEPFVHDKNINGIHYVTADILLGTTDTFQLKAGDLLLTGDDMTLSGNSISLDSGFSNSLSVKKEDVFVFRPDDTSDYSVGSFALLLENPLDKELWGLTLIEKDTLLGDVTLEAGDFLFSRSGGAEDNDIWLYTTTDVGLSTTSGTAEVLIEGDDAGVSINEKIYGLDLVETTVTIGGQTLVAGTLLVSLERSEEIGSGDDVLPVTEFDIFSLGVTKTSLGSGAGNGQIVPSLFFDGSVVLFEDGKEAIDGFTLTTSHNFAPVITLPSAPLSYAILDDYTVIDPFATVDDVDSLDFNGGSLTVHIAAGASAGDMLTVLSGGDVSLVGSDVWYGSTPVIIGTVRGFPFNGVAGADLVIDWNANSTPEGVEAVLQQIAYKNIFGTPIIETQLIEFVIDDGDGGISNIAQQLVEFAAVNSAPVLSRSDTPNTYTENSAPVIIDSSFSVTDSDSVDLDGGTLTVSIITNRGAEDTLSILPGNGVVLNGFDIEVGGSGNVIGTYSGGTAGTDLVITWGGSANATPAVINDVLGQIAFSNASDDPNNLTRTISFTISDGDGGTSLPVTQQVFVQSVNDAPSSSSNTVSTDEDTAYTFNVDDFGFTDLLDDDSFHAVKITSLPLLGSLTLDGVLVGVGDFISVDDINLGLLQYTPPLNAFGTAYASFTFQVQDSGGTVNGGVDLSTSSTMTIDVVNVNDLPTGTGTINTTMLLDSDSEVKLFDQITVTDPDGESDLTIRVVLDDPALGTLDGGGLLETFAGSGIYERGGLTAAQANVALDVLQFTPATDIASSGTVPVGISVQVDDGDSGFQTISGPTTLTITRVNDAPTIVNNNIEIDEGQSLVLDSTMLSATDVDDTDSTLEYYVSAVTNGYFERVSTGLSLTVFTQADLDTGDEIRFVHDGSETAASFNFYVTDGMTPSATVAANITFTNTNDAPVISSANTVTAAENQTDVITVTADDDDGDTPTFAISGGADAGLFSMTAGGVLTFNAAPNFETFADADSDGVYEVEVTATDPSMATDVQTLLVTVTDVNEAPTGVTLSNSAIDENTDTSSGTLIGTLTSSDPDTGDSASYSINGGADAARFSLSGSDLILTDGVLNFEAKSSYEVTVQVTDSGGLTHDQTLTINVNDLNEAPVFASTTVTSVAEDSLYSYSISTSDVDGDLLTISAAVLPSWLTFTDNEDGTASLTGTPSNAEVGDHSVELLVTDPGGLSASQNFTVTVTNTNDAPVISSANTVTAAENQTDVITVTADDDDGDTPTFAISGGADAGLFSMTAGGVLTFNAAPNFETFADADSDGVYEVEVTATDPSMATDVQTLLVTVTDVNEAPTGVTLSNSAIDENTDTSSGTLIGTLTSSDPDTGDSASYSINGGADAARFSLSGSDLILTDGVLNFEAKSSYEVTVQVTDSGGLTHDQTLTINVNDLNEAPVFASTTVTSVAEDSLYSYSISTSDVDGDLLTISAAVLPSWLTFTDNEDGTASLTGTPSNAEVGDHSVELLVTDPGGLSASQNFTVTVTNTNDAPVISSANTVTAAENQTDVITVTADDDDGDTPTFAISGGADAGLFSMTAGGVLTFNAAPNFETFADADSDGVYEVEVTATDPSMATDVQTLLVTVTDVNEAPTGVTLSNSAIDENTDTSSGTLIGTLTSSDPDTGDSASYSINGGADAARFSLSGSDLILTDGVLNFEAKSSYEVTVQVTDSGGLTHDQTLTINVNDLNEAPVFASTTVTSVAEDSLYSYSISTSDVDGDLLTISAAVLPSWLTFTDNEDGTASLTGTPSNAEVGDHSVELLVTDPGGLSASQNFTVTVTNTNDAPVISSANTVTAAENQTDVITVTADDDDGDTPTFAISGGADAGLFSMTAGGVLTFNAAPNFETFADADSDGVYEVEVTATDPSMATDVQTLLVTVTDVNEAPTGVTLSNSAIDENTDTSSGTLIGTLTSSDPDTGDSASYSINGGADAARFSLSGSDLILTDGVLNFEAKSSYEVTVQVTDSGGLTHDQTLTINVNDLNEAPVFASTTVTSVAEDSLYSYSISTSDVDGDLLTISAAVLPSWLTFTDNEDGTASLTGTPSNAEVGDHSVELLVTDPGGLSASQNFTVTVTNTNDAPVISSANTVTAAENQTDVITVTADDDDGDTPTFAISGGADAGLFSMTAGGVLTFNAAPNFETFADADSDGVYEVEVTATDPSMATDVQTLLVTVTDVNEAPTGVTLSNSAIDENTDTSSGTLIGTLTSSDPDTGDSASYSINGGADAARFSLSGSDLILTDGVLNFEAKSSYEVTVQVTDSGGLTHDQTLTINVNDLNEAPVFASTTVTSVAEDSLYSYSISTSDVDGDLLTISAAVLPSWLTFTDNEDGTASLTGTPSNAEVGDHSVELLVTDPGGLSASQNFTVTVTNTNDAPVISSANTVTAAENQTDVITVTADDDDGDTPTFAISGGADAGLFSMTAGGVLTFNAAPNFETFADADSDGVYEVEVTATDPSMATDVQTLLVTVTDVNEAPTGVNDSITATEDTLLTFDVFTALLANDTDPEGDVLLLTDFTQPAHGDLVDNGDGTLTYTPHSNYFGNDTFDYSIVDEAGHEVTGKVYLVVTPVGDTPQITNVSTTVGVQSGLIFIRPNAADGPEISHFNITGINSGTLYLADGTTIVENGDFITVTQGQAGLRFTPDGSSLVVKFNVQSSEDGTSIASQSDFAVVTVNVDSPTVVIEAPAPEEEINEEVIDEEAKDDAPDENNEIAAEMTAIVDVVAKNETGAGTDKVKKVTPFFNKQHSRLDLVDFTRELKKSSTDLNSISRNLRLLIDKTVISSMIRQMDNYEITILSQDVYQLVHKTLDAIQSEIEADSQVEKVVVVSTIATSVGLSAGYVVWLIQGGSLLTSVLASLPAWQLADPLSILAGHKADDDDDESLENIIKEGSDDDEEEEETSSESGESL